MLAAVGTSTPPTLHAVERKSEKIQYDVQRERSTWRGTHGR